MAPTLIELANLESPRHLTDTFVQHTLLTPLTEAVSNLEKDLRILRENAAEIHHALDELAHILKLGEIYPFFAMPR